MGFLDLGGYSLVMGKSVGARPARVLVFDSGVGGLSIVQELRRRLPGVALDYLVDNAFSPYGNKGDQALKDRIPGLLKVAVERSGADLMVVACNTASTAALSELRDTLRIPVVGTVPAIKPAAERTKSGAIGVLATPATIKSEAMQDLLRDHAKGCHVVTCGSMALVRLAEAKLRGHFLPNAVLQQAIAPLFCEDAALSIDHVVLGCTHFPLLREELEKAANSSIAWLDSGFAIAERVAMLLEPCKSSASEASDQRAFFTTWTPGLGSLRPAFSAHGFREMTWIAAPQKLQSTAA